MFRILNNSQKKLFILHDYYLRVKLFYLTDDKQEDTEIEKRYCINVLFDLFYSSTYTFSKGNVTSLRKIGKKPSS